VGTNETSGTLNVENSADITLSGATASLIVGTHTNSSSGSPIASLLQSGTSLITAPSVVIGNGVNGSASVSGGTLDATTGGITLGTSTGAGGTAATIGNGTLTITGGTVETGASSNVVLCAAASAFASEEGTLNLQGGLLNISGALQSNNTGTPANSVVNFTGGELRAATVSPADFVSGTSQSALPVALQQTSDALVQTNTASASLLHAATQNLAINGGYVLLGGAAQADGGETISVSGLTSVNSGTIQGAGTFATSATNGFGINGTLTVSGPGIVNLNGPSANNSAGASLNVTGGTVNVSAASTTPATLSIGASGTVNLNAGSSVPATSTVTVDGQLNFGSLIGGVTVASLTIGGSGVVNIDNNHMVVADPGGVPDDATFSSIIGWVKNSAITSTAGTPGYAVGLVDGNDGVSGSPVSANTIEAAYTLYGDANLDDKVDATDFGIFAPNFGLSTTLGWEAGDFNYDGKVDATDFGLFAPNFGLTDSGVDLSLPAADYAALNAFAAANGLSLTSVPEPASTAMVVMAGLGILRRRRRAARTTT